MNLRGVQILFLIRIEIGAISNKRFRRAKRGTAGHFLRKANGPLERRAPQTWEGKHGLLCGGSGETRNSPILLCPRMRYVFAISRENLVSADAREQDGRLVACFAANEKCRNYCGVGS